MLEACARDDRPCLLVLARPYHMTRVSATGWRGISRLTATMAVHTERRTRDHRVIIPTHAVSISVDTRDGRTLTWGAR